jgi:hypothetical protein
LSANFRESNLLVGHVLVDGEMDEESIANLTRIVANFRECNVVDGHVTTFALIRAQFASIRDCAFQRRPSSQQSTDP